MQGGFRDILHRLQPEEEALVHLATRVQHSLSGDVIVRAEAVMDMYSRNWFISDSNITLLERALELCGSLMGNIQSGLEAGGSLPSGVEACVVREAYDRWLACNDVARRLQSVLVAVAQRTRDEAVPDARSSSSMGTVVGGSAGGRSRAAVLTSSIVRATSPPPVRPLDRIVLPKQRRTGLTRGVRAAKNVTPRAAAREWQRLIATMGLEAGNAAFEEYLMRLPDGELQKLESDLQSSRV